MLFEREEDFAKACKDGGPNGVCLLYGDESYLVEAWRSRILKRFGGEEDFNFQRLDGKAPNLNALYDATQTLPSFGGEKCVLLDSLDLSKLNADEMKDLSGILEECPPECLLLITARPPAFDKKSAAGKKVIAMADKYGWAAILPSRTGAGLVKFLQQAASRDGSSISPELCRKLLDIAENDMLSLSREMEKLAAYAGGGEITKAHIDAVVTPRTDARVFDLSKAIDAGNGQRAFEILGDLFYLREAPIAILGVLCTAYTDLYRARVARESGIPSQEVIARFGYKGREFRINNAYRSRLSLAALRKSLRLLADCDRKLKSTSIDDRLLLEQTVAGLLSLREV